jgi:hypothetical protein
MSAGRPILVTGALRSGTTWCGRLIAEATSAYYIHEPFNLYSPWGICPVKFDRWFQYVDDHNAAKYEDAMQRPATLRFAIRKHLWASLQGKRQNTGTGLRGVIWGGREALRWRRARRHSARPLLKDPIALFSAEWIARAFDAQVVVTIRHPAAFVHSIRRAGWGHDFSTFVEQPELMSTLLAPYKDEVAQAAKKAGDLTEQAILLWKLNHHVIAKYRDAHPEWLFVRNEDLATRPIEGYASLFRELGAAFGDAEREVVQDFTEAATGAGNERTSLHAVRRDSQYEARKWRYELDPSIIQRVKRETHPLWSKFYDEHDWEMEEKREV